QDVVPETFRHDLYCRYCGSKMRDKKPDFQKSPIRTIMVVDDEPDVVSVFRQALRSKGYSVAGFTDPVLALREFDLNHEMYDLVIADNRMQRMTGLGFIINVKRLRPDIKVILVSGYELDNNQRSSYPIVELLTKPISASKLTETVEKYVSVN